MKKRHALEEIREYVEMRYDIRRNALTLEMEIKSAEKESYSLLDEAYINSIWFYQIIKIFVIFFNTSWKTNHRYIFLFTKLYNFKIWGITKIIKIFLRY